jgi:hypothetical protein
MRRSTSIRAALAVVGAGVLALTSSSSASWGVSAGWHRVVVKQGEQADSAFGAAFVVGPRDAWVAGARGRSGGSTNKAVLEHWDGSSFSSVPPASTPGVSVSYLEALDGTGPDDVWAVGLQIGKDQAAHGLIEHWDGSAWRQSDGPPDEPPGSSLVSVSAASPSDVWAVGDSNPGGGVGSSPLIEHFDGHRWKISQGLDLPRFLHTVDAVSPTDVWATGNLDDDTPPVIEHFDGTGWTVVDQPVRAHGTELNSFSDLGPDNIWAVGETGVHTLVEHWNGHQWSVVPSVDGDQLSALTSVSAVAHNDVWAVGVTGFDLGDPLAEHWDGHTWTLTGTPEPGISDQLTSVSAAAGGPVFAVGSMVEGSAPYLRHGLVLQH